MKNSNIFKINKFSILKNNLIKSLPDYFSIDFVNYINVWGCIFFAHFFYNSTTVGSFQFSILVSLQFTIFSYLVLNSIYAPYYAINSNLKIYLNKINFFIKIEIIFYNNFSNFLILFIYSNFFLENILDIYSDEFNIIFKVLVTKFISKNNFWTSKPFSKYD